MKLDNVEDVYPLTPMQEGLLVESIGAGPVYVSQVELELTAPAYEHGSPSRAPLEIATLDTDRWRRAWEAVVARHASLRTEFHWDGLDEPLQVVRQRVELPWSEADGRRWSESEIDRWRADERREIDPAHAPLQRIALAQVGEDEWRCLWTFHHLIADGWSARRVVGEVASLYASLHEGGEDVSSPFLYRDYVAYLRAGGPGDGESGGGERFWRAELEGAVPTSTGLVRVGGAESPRLERAGARLTPEETAGLVAWSAGERITLGTAVQGAWAWLLGAYCGEDDVVFGLTTAGRSADLEGIEEAVGLFVHTLPVRVGIESAAPLGDWLRALQHRGLKRMEHEGTSLARIQRWSGVAPGESLFDTLVVIENQPPTAVPAGFGLDLEWVDVREQSHYPLALLVLPGTELELTLVYDAARVDAEDARRLVRHAAAVLCRMAAGDCETVGDLTVPPGEGDDRDPEEPTAPDGGYEDVVTAFARQVDSTASATALSSNGVELSYGELAGRVAALAGELEERDVGSGDRVAIAAERSVDFVVAALAVLSRGAAYLPLDPGYPAPYLGSMLESGSPRLLVVPSGARDRFASLAMPVVEMPDPSDRGSSRAAETRRPGAVEPDPPDSLAYILFTSGSTGRPKGVEVTRANLAASTAARSAWYCETPRRFLMLSSFAFDSSVAGLYWTLTTGGELVLEPGVEHDLDALAAIVESRRITHLLLLPTLYRLLLEHAGPEALASLETVIVAGEACPADLAELHFATLPETRLVNEYGPTEATVWCAAHELTPADAGGADQGGTVPIGRAIPGARLHVLDHRQRPCADGLPGELWVGGAGVARGYAGDDHATAGSFRELDPGTGRRERLYRTGDRVRRRGDGALLFLGRVDDQLKVRGHRIEPAGVEARLLEHPSIAAVAVAARSLGRSTGLVAWAVSRPGGDTPPSRELSAWAGERLPAFAVPDRWVWLEELPRLPNGKTDYRSLPEPGDDDVATAAGGRLPESRAERDVAEVWQELLGCGELSADSHFYELGGDSILAIQLVSRLRARGYRLTPAQVARRPTVEALAARLEGEPVEADATAESTKPPPDPSEPIPLLPVQAWFLARRLAAPHHWNLARRFEVPADFDPQRFEAALAACLDRHEQLRVGFRETADGWLQEAAPAGSLDPPFEVVDLPQGDREARERVVAEAQASFDLGRPPLLRTLWFPGAAGESGELVVIVHHLVFDAASWPILLADLQAACRGTQLSTAAGVFREWALLATDGSVDAEVEFWHEDAVGHTPLPVDRDPVEPSSEADVERLEVRIEGEALGSLEGARIEAVLLAALYRAWRRWTGGSKLRLAIERHGRPPSLDSSGTVGWFTVSHPLTLELEDDTASAVRSVRTALEGVPVAAGVAGHGWGALRYLRADAVVAALPEPEILFNYLGRSDPGGAADGGAADGGAGDGWRRLAEPVAGSRDPRNGRSHLLEVNAALGTAAHGGGSLSVEWIWCRTVHGAETRARVTQLFRDELEAAIADLGRPESRFEQAELDGSDLDRLLARIESDDG